MCLPLVVFIDLFFVIECTSAAGNIYCGQQTCYEILGVNRDADISAIQKAYRSLAKQHHPDRQTTQEGKAAAEQDFVKIAAAYEILRDAEQRGEYDYMLDHPEEMYYNYYRYYRRRYSQKVDVRLVVFGTILVVSIIQYLGQRTKHNQAVNFLVRDPKHRAKAKELALMEGRFRVKKQDVGRRLTREELKEREDEVIRSVIIETVDLRGDCAAPNIRNTLLVQLLFLPFWLIRVTFWASRWIILFFILRRPYGPEEQEFLTRWKLGFSQTRWEGLDENTRAQFMQLELWIPEKLSAYREKQVEELRIRSAESTNYKRYRRYMKRVGPAEINLENL
ncbi:DnaJ sub C member 25 [Sparganum proliferum]